MKLNCLMAASVAVMLCACSREANDPTASASGRSPTLIIDQSHGSADNSACVSACTGTAVSVPGDLSGNLKWWAIY